MGQRITKLQRSRFLPETGGALTTLGIALRHSVSTTHTITGASWLGAAQRFSAALGLAGRSCGLVRRFHGAGIGRVLPRAASRRGNVR